MAKPKPNQNQLLLQPNYSHLIFDAFVTIRHQDRTKNHNFTYSPILLPRQKKANPSDMANQNPTKINSFCNHTFHSSFFMHLWQFLTKIA